MIIETFLIVFVVYISFFKKTYDPKTRNESKLTDKEIDQLCDEWEPEPLVPSNIPTIQPRGITENIPGAYIQVKGSSEVLNFATNDPCGLATRVEIQNTISKTLEKYGCGSCGPRGFYGSIDLHEELEEKLATFLGTEKAIIYSDGDATISSVIPCFAKRGDMLIVDKGCNDSIMKGASLARCRVLYYNSNDMDDLQHVLETIRQADEKAGRKSDCQRRYVVTEGIFRKTGEIVKLPQLVALCQKYCIRIILDESFSFATLGKTGKGVTEYYDMDINEIDIICGSLSNSIASVGGFSAGSSLVVDNQRINSAGYVFSAAAPPFTSAASIEALRIMKDEVSMFETLKKIARYAYDSIEGIEGLHLLSCRDSPILYAQVENGDTEGVVEACFKAGLAINGSRYKTNQTFDCIKAIRLSVSILHEESHIDQAVEILGKIVAPTRPSSSRRKKAVKEPSMPLRRSRRKRNAPT